MMDALIGYAAAACLLAGLITGVVTLALGREPRAALRIALDFWLAAGVLRLTAGHGWEPLLVAAAIVAVRQLTVAPGRLRERDGR